MREWYTEWKNIRARRDLELLGSDGVILGCMSGVLVYINLECSQLQGQHLKMHIQGVKAL